MARTFIFPAQYTRLVESQLALLGAEIGRDVKWRADADEFVQHLAPVPDAMLDTDLEGRICIVIVPADITEEPALPTHLTALSRIG